MFEAQINTWMKEITAMYNGIISSVSSQHNMSWVQHIYSVSLHAFKADVYII